ncbi:MAG: glycosyltransferase [Flavobacteriaceae bacterium]
MIPKIIHFCWYGKGKYNETITKCIASWKKKLPEYEIKKWDETNTPFDKLPFLNLLYKQKKWSFITDFIRLYAVYTEGGIYLDTDIEILKPFNELLEEQVFLGFQSDLESSKYPLNSAVLGGIKGHEFLYQCLCETEKKQRLKFNAMGGPPIVTQVAFANGLKTYKKQYINKGVLLLPTSYFYPFSWEESYTLECIKPETICIHWWEDSWKNKKKKFNYYTDSLERKFEKIPLLVSSWFVYLFNKKNFFSIKSV